MTVERLQDRSEKANGPTSYVANPVGTPPERSQQKEMLLLLLLLLLLLFAFMPFWRGLLAQKMAFLGGRMEG